MQINRHSFLIAILVAPSLLPLSASGQSRKLTIQEAEQRLADYWVEVEITAGGKKLPETDHFCWSFVYDAEKKSPYCWLRRGEAVLSVCGSIGIEKVLDDGAMHIKVNGFPGLMKFDGTGFIVVTPGAGGPQGVADVPTAVFLKVVRPMDFTSTRENGHVVRHMKRTSGLYATEPLPEPRPRPTPKKDR